MEGGGVGCGRVRGVPHRTVLVGDESGAALSCHYSVHFIAFCTRLIAHFVLLPLSRCKEVAELEYPRLAGVT